jgi:hypothetical protein
MDVGLEATGENTISFISRHQTSGPSLNLMAANESLETWEISNIWEQKQQIRITSRRN